MKKTINLLLICSIFWTGCNESSIQVSTIYDYSHQMAPIIKQSGVPALVLTALDRKDHHVKIAYGPAHWKLGDQITPDHIFRIFSMTKLVTSVAALQLVEKGLINLDDPVEEWLPEIAEIPIIENFQLVQSKNPITLRHLLTHTSGFGYSFTDSTLKNFHSNSKFMGGYSMPNGSSTTNWPYSDLPRKFESGSDFLYGTSLDWVGTLIECVSGETLEDYFKLNVFMPLEMNHTFFNIPDSLHHLVVSRGSHGNDGKQPLFEIEDKHQLKVNKFSGGGGLYSSPNDFTTLLACLLHQGSYKKSKILNKETVELMFTNQVGKKKIFKENAYYDPSSCCDFKGIMDERSKWGLATMIDTTRRKTGRKAGTALWAGYLNTYFFIDFKSGVAVTLFAQYSPFNNPAAIKILDHFTALLYQNGKSYHS